MTRENKVCSLCGDPVEIGKEWHCPDHWEFAPFFDGVPHQWCGDEILAYEVGYPENHTRFGVIKF